MQTFSWYLKRLKSMSPGEILWRTGSLTRDVADLVRIPAGLLPALPHLEKADSLQDTPRGFSLQRATADFDRLPDATQRRDSLIRAAGDIADGYLTFFNLERQFLGNPIDWHKDHSAGISSSRQLIQFVNYRDFASNGDCKQVWEPNRHHQFVVLARAWSATAKPHFAVDLKEQMLSWIAANPFGYGMNWRSPLELAVRAINWVMALELARTSGEFRGDEWRTIYRTLHLHCWEMQRKFSRGSSANNHLVGELAGVFVLASYLPDLPGSDRLIAQTRSRLEAEILRQSFRDGATREQALGYQFFVIQFYLICGLVGRWTGNEFAAEYWDRLQAMFEFVARLAEGGRLPMYGDQDDGYVLDLGEKPQDVGALMHTAAQLFELSPAAASLARDSETAYWLFGSERRGLQPSPESVAPSPSVAFPDSGYYLLQAWNERNVISVLFDCAELGYGSIAAHGHADALAVAIRINGEHLFVDPGTFDYFTHPEWRNYFRSTMAHNTVVIDDHDQSQMQGPFMWGHRATARCVRWESDDRRTIACGEHDGYTRLADPVSHRRTVAVDHATCRCDITDEITAASAHDIGIFFHLGPTCVVDEVRDNQVRISIGGNCRVRLEFDPRLRIASFHGSEQPRAGWYSPAYHRKVPVTTLVGKATIPGAATFAHSIVVEEHY